MSWKILREEYVSGQANKVACIKDASGGPQFNAMWMDDQEDSNAVWRYNILEGRGMWVGVCTEDKFGSSYGIKALLYGGPGNLSSGGGLVKARIIYIILIVFSS